MARPVASAKPESSEPKTKLVTLAQIVSATGISAGHIARAVKGGFVIPAGRGQYEFGPTLLGLLRYQQAHWGELPLYENAAQCSAATGIPMAVIRQARKTMKLGKSGWIELKVLLSAIFAGHGENWTEMREKFAALREKQNYEREHGEVLVKSEASHTIKHGLASFFRALEQREDVDLPPLLEGMSAAEMRAELNRSRTKLTNQLVADWSLLMRNGEAKDAR
jgi:hypothetical protein